MDEVNRYVLTTGNTSVIRDMVSTVLAGVKSEKDLTPDSRERLQAFLNGQCERLVLDLRTTRELPSDISPRVRNLRVSHLGQVLVVTGEVTSPGIFREIEALRRPRFSLQHLACGLLAFVHVLF